MGLRSRGNVIRKMQSMDKLVKAELQAALIDYGDDKVIHFRQVVNDWKNKPQFIVRSVVNNKVYKVSVVPSGEHADKFIWIDIGTGRYGPKRSAYPIRPKYAKALRFTTGYSARTQPIAQFSVGSGKASGPVVFAQEVMHPGIKSREFNKTFDIENKPVFIKSIHKAVKKGVQRAR